MPMFGGGNYASNPKVGQRKFGAAQAAPDLGNVEDQPPAMEPPAEQAPPQGGAASIASAMELMQQAMQHMQMAMDTNQDEPELQDNSAEEQAEPGDQASVSPEGPGRKIPKGLVHHASGGGAF